MEHGEKSLSGNLDDFAEELLSPVRNFNIALEDSVETILEKTTVRNLESTIEQNTGIEMSGSLLEHEKVNFSASWLILRRSFILHFAISK